MSYPHDAVRSLYLALGAGISGFTDGDLIERGGKWHKTLAGENEWGIPNPCVSGWGCIVIRF